MIKILDNNYSTTRLCYKLLDDKYLDENGKIKEEFKFKLNFPEFEIVDSKISAKEGEKFDTYLFLPKGEGRKGEGGLRTKGYFKFSYKKVDSEWYVVGSNSEKIKKIELPITNYPLQTTYYPLITIITVVYNGEKYLEETIQSVINQTYPNVEYIIIDGGSTDGTLDIIKKYEDKIDYWVSEKDKGIYDAMNKGIDLASGEWINFMNAGDKFYDEKVLEKVFEKNKHTLYDMIYGSTIVVNKNKKILLKPKLFTRFNLLFWMTRTVCHQAIFVNKKIIPKYSLKYRLKDELNWYFEINKKSKKSLMMEIPIVYYSLGGFSDINHMLDFKETIKVVFNKSGILGILSFPILLYKFMRRIFND